MGFVAAAEDGTLVKLDDTINEDILNEVTIAARVELLPIRRD